MRSICEYTENEYQAMSEKRRALLQALNSVSGSVFDELWRTRGYAHYKFKGKYSDRLVEALGRHPDTDEIIMLVDGGFSHFGASCTIDIASQRFHGRVNTD